ncbi:TPA_exp: putative C2H2 finger domain protein [Trichophyton benhamiae CBS 112371]|uniref:C2H2 finger domain protein, putative n=1 Tax=Arthroderma benhamiae (strain ATCC MYA-4681 / CBS 112371) TaxID=663331 RepID=D4AMX3_ARTBC|nr:C2H2 finger domain protein, putative [Trichophyton benhamiae CBS 112371]EFE35534.1 C2H2 finger domain protein, putative [Trichophyton benhamiae CBS 112371]DAA78380.1 TPA_exp: putative C2H2 finger domain protein [Trichophyton benhamiae CBS 112371]
MASFKRERERERSISFLQRGEQLFTNDSLALEQQQDSSSSRPLPQAIPNPRQASNGRTHSHSVSLGALNYNHRVTRRKSMTSSAANNTNNNAAAAAAAAVISESGASAGAPIHTSHHRRGLSLRRAAGLESTSAGSSSPFGPSSHAARNGMAAVDRKPGPGSLNSSSAVSEELPAGTGAAGRPISIKHRSRRASEGSHLMKGEGKRSLVELKCDRCGKGYKHSSCLTKHMWEHDPAWAVTSKLLISKHQQVQLLEAASVLVTLNEPVSEEQAAARAAAAAAAAASGSGDSDRSSTSPTVSGISELRDGLSSTETTPPPTGDDGALSKSSNDPYRYPSSHSSYNHNHNHSFSQSLQSIPSASFASASSVPSYSPAHSHFRHSSTDTRPSTADTNGVLDDDAAGLAAAIELCNFGTPRSGPMAILEDVPPVPPLPARFLGQSVGSTMAMANSHSNGFFGDNSTVSGQSSSMNFSHNSGSSVSGATITGNLAASTPNIFDALPMATHAHISYRVSDERDVKMADIKPDTITQHSNLRNDSTSPANPQHSRSLDDESDRGSPSSVVHMDDDDDGVFGHMEE